MGCGSCGKRNRLARYRFLCLNCNEMFVIETASGIINENNNFYIKNANKIQIKHGKCGSTRICKKN
jgi:coenzyme F420-reducing hydrogenase beta subunit